MKRHHSKRLKIVSIIIIVILAAAGITAGVLIFDRRADAPKVTAPVKAAPTKSTPPATTPITPVAFDKTKYSTTDSTSLWVIVNKQHPLTPVAYAPSDLVTAYGHQVSSRMVPDLTDMITDATKDGANLTLVSSYRSYTYQVGLYNSYVNKDGQAGADEYSARPGYSEHQTGLAIDFGDKAGTCSVEACYADTSEGKWLAANAYKYGFLLRYTAEKESVTGYEAESWHYRYIGRDLAMEMHTENITTLEEFFGVTGGVNY